MVNLYFPGTVKRGDHIADFGLMTPKQVARCLYTFGKSHPELHLKVIEIPQVPGSLRRSRPVRGAAESGLKIKRYLFTLIAIQPEIPVVLTALYLDHGRWQMNQHAEIVGPTHFLSTSAIASEDPGREPSATASGTAFNTGVLP